MNEMDKNLPTKPDSKAPNSRIPVATIKDGDDVAGKEKHCNAAWTSHALGSHPEQETDSAANGVANPSVSTEGDEKTDHLRIQTTNTFPGRVWSTCPETDNSPKQGRKRGRSEVAEPERRQRNSATAPLERFQRWWNKTLHRNSRNKSPPKTHDSLCKGTSTSPSLDSRAPFTQGHAQTVGGDDQDLTATAKEACTAKVVHESTLLSLDEEAMSPRSRLLAHRLMALGGDSRPISSPVSSEPDQLSLGPMVFGVASARGRRPYMEDRHAIVQDLVPMTAAGAPMPSDGTLRSFAGIYDGHNGVLAAEHAANRLHELVAGEPALRTCIGSAAPAATLQESQHMTAALVHAFEAIDHEILTRCRRDGGRDGATGIVIVRLGEMLYAANCGDSRAVLCRGGEPLRLTEDHKPNLPRERLRVEALGGRVDFARCWRVIVDPGDGRPASGLAVSRSFGDLDFKEPLHLVIATPDVMSEHLVPEDEFVILASDGVWDVLADKQACDVVCEKLRSFAAPSEELSESDNRSLMASLAAEAVLEASLDAGTMDNVTVIVGLMKWD